MKFTLGDLLGVAAIIGFVTLVFLVSSIIGVDRVSYEKVPYRGYKTRDFIIEIIEIPEGKLIITSKPAILLPRTPEKE